MAEENMNKANVTNIPPEEQREQFSDRWGFILACIGSAVGMANVWMFPYRVGKYGGAAFLIPYFICVIVLGFSGVAGEMAFGRAMRTGPLGAFRKAFESKGIKRGRDIGIIPVLGSLAIGIGYAVVVGWVLRFLWGSISGSMMNATDTGAYFGAIAGPYGSIGWHMLGLAIGFILLSLGVSNGIEKVNKFMMPAFFVLFIVLAIRVATLPGAMEGYKYLMVPKWEFLLDPKTWIFALGQCFFSLSLAGSGTVVYGSYLSKKESVINCALNVGIFDTLAACLSTLVVIPAVFAYGFDPQAGPPLLFITIPAIFQQMPMGRIFAIFFFIAVLFAAITSLINLFETPIEALQQRFKMSRVKAILCVAVVSAGVGVFIENGNVVGTWMDVVSIYVIPLGALISAFIFFWVLGPKFAREQIQLGNEKPIGKWLEPMTKYVFCAITVGVYILGIFFGGI
ncbi:sodium-dependent transporter [Oscillospiraceae bacterium PP1C4]